MTPTARRIGQVAAALFVVDLVVSTVLAIRDVRQALAEGRSNVIPIRHPRSPR